MNISPISSLNKFPDVYFQARKKVNPDEINNKLIYLRRNDFIDGLTRWDTHSADREYNLNKVDSYYKSFNDQHCIISNENNNYYFHKYTALIKKTVMENENPRIIREMPAIFKEIPENELFDCFDTLSYMIREDKIKEFSFCLGDKIINADYCSEGGEGIIYKLSDQDNNCAKLKVYKNPEQISDYGMFGELAIYHATRDVAINDIPSLYLASPVCVKVEDKSKELYLIYNPDTFIDYDGYKGGWGIFEFIEHDTPKKQEGISIFEWMKQKNFYCYDLKSTNFIGKYLVDLGAIVPLK